MLRFLRTRVFPWAVWLGAMGTAGWLWHGVHFGSARGFVEPADYGVTTPVAGRVASLGVQVGQQVRAGDVIAVIESREIAAEIEVLAAERRRVEAELGAVEDSTQVEVGEFARRLEESVDAAELARSTARAEQKVRAAELAAINRQADVVRELVDKRMADRRDLVEIEVNQATVKKELEQTDSLIRQLEGQVNAARTRRTGVPVATKARATEPLRAELLVLISQQQLLKVQQDAMVLRAPADGQVTAVFVRPHEVAMPGLPIATISGAARSPTVLACLDEVQAAKISTGEAARLRTLDGTGQLHHAHVARV
ncbi:MAG: biotin/lipoyl-binding protein, partial [Deltaproteobacteria bacterium]|nr:biotin/lipoyl-binding protein [Nannocystaceae bacterium]